jgi:hypothetical protein
VKKHQLENALNSSASAPYMIEPHMSGIFFTSWGELRGKDHKRLAP